MKDFGRNGGNVVLELDSTSPISVGNATWDVVQQQEGFESGSLTVRGHTDSTGASSMAFLDASMRSGLSPFGSLASFEFQVSWCEAGLHH